METNVQHTPGPWFFVEFMGKSTLPALDNQGARFLMAGSPDGDDRRRVALVDCQTEFKRGKGHETACAERDANARLIAASPDLLAACLKADRIEMLRDSIGECHARINGAGRTTSAESVTLSRKQLAEYREELRTIRAEIRAAIASTESST